MNKTRPKCGKAPKSRVCFDIETYPFSKEFEKASPADKIKFVPAPRIVCVYVESSRRYKFFAPNVESMEQLAAILNNATEVISYNGEQYDFLVLERHYPELFAGITEKVKSIDMMLVSQRETDCNYYFSLNKMAMVNLGQGKMVEGRAMNSLDIEKIKTACQSDVRQTYKLWKLWQNGTIQYPPYRKCSRVGGPFWGNAECISIQVRPPVLCPECGDVNSIEIIEEGPEDFEDMTEGQWADYHAGWNRSAECTTCGMTMFLG
jgi:hypothetical protein